MEATQIASKGDNVHSIADTMASRHDSSKKEEEGDSFKLKYIEKLSNEHLLIGNSYQLDMLRLNVKNNFIDVEYKWSICPSELISSISIDMKCSFWWT